MRTFSLGLMLFVAGMLAAPAGAAVSYSYSYVTDAKTYSGPVGSIVPVNIYLQETLSGTSTSYITANNGVSSAGAAVNVKSTTGGTAASFGTGMLLYTSSSSFGNPSTTTGNFPTLVYNQGTGAAANNLEFEQTITNAQPGVTPTSSLLLLGTLDVTVGSGTTTYVLTSLNEDTIADGPNGFGAEGDGNTLVQGPPGNAGNNFFPGTDLDKSGATPSGAVDPGTITGADANSLSSPYTFTVGPGSAPVPRSRFRSP